MVRPKNHSWHFISFHSISFTQEVIFHVAVLVANSLFCSPDNPSFPVRISFELANQCVSHLQLDIEQLGSVLKLEVRVVEKCICM